MRKIVLAAAAVAGVLAISACKGEEAPVVTETTEVATEAAPAETAAATEVATEAATTEAPKM